MILFGRQIAGRLLGMIVGGLLLFLLVSFGLYQCDKRRSERAQSRVDAAQSEAATNSAADAIGTVSRRGAEETASENLTRSNEREIRGADGAGERIKPGVDYAGRAALCRRQAYKDSERCKMFRKDAQ
jgi:hypothetical protein